MLLRSCRAVGNQPWDMMKNIWCEKFMGGIRCMSGTGCSLEWLSERDFFMKLRTLLLAAVALVVLAGSVVPANAAVHHRRHHRHHRHS